MKTTLKRALGLVLALCILVASATCLMGTSVFAETPVSTNVAKINESLQADRDRVLYSEQNPSTPAYNAFDGNKTNSNANQWWTGNPATGWIIIDLGAVYALDTFSLLTRTDGARTYSYDIYVASYLPGIEYSLANKANVYAALKAGTKVASATKKAGLNTHYPTGTTTVNGRYVLLDVTYGSGGLNVAEFEIYGIPFVPEDTTTSNDGKPTVDKNIAHNYVSSLATDSLKAKAVRASKTVSQGFNALDGVVANNSNKNQWYPGAAPAYLLIDLGDVYNLSAANITFRTKATGNRTFTYALYSAASLTVDFATAAVADIKAEMAVAANQITTSKTVTCVDAVSFANQKPARYVLLDITAAGGDVNLFEIEIFGYNLKSSFAIDEANKTITLPGGLGLTAQDVMDSINVGGNAYATIEKGADDAIAAGDYFLVTHTGTTLSTDLATPFPGVTAYKFAFEDDNLAAGITSDKVLASGYEGSCIPLNAFDGAISNNNADKWMVTLSNTHKPWLVVDLGANYTLQAAQSYIFGATTDSQARLYYYNLYVADSADFTGDFNEDNKAEVAAGIMANGTKVATVNASTASYGGTFSEFNATGRYVLLEYTGGNASATMSFYELELFGYVFESNELKVNNATSTISVPYSWGKNVTADMILNDLTISKAVAKVNDAGNELTVTYSKGASVGTNTYTIAYPNFTSVAQGTSILASGYDNPYKPERLVDGKGIDENDTAYKWQVSAINTSTVWAMVDLGATYNLEAIKTHISSGKTDGTGTRRYLYEVYVADEIVADWSEDNKAAIAEGIMTSDNLVLDVDNNQVASNIGGTYSEIDVKGRYLLIRPYKEYGNQSGTISFFELEVFGYTVTAAEAGVKVDNVNNTITMPFTWGKDLTDANIANALAFAGNANFEVKDGKVVVNTMNGKTAEYTVGKAAAANTHVNKGKGNFTFYKADGTKIENIEAGAEEKTTVKVSFEYYTANSMGFRLQFKDAEGNIVYNGLGLPTGRNKFEQEVEVSAETGALTPFIAGANANFYIWNIAIYVGMDDAEVAYANGSTGTTTYITKEAASSETGCDLAQEQLVTKVDLTDINYENIDRNIWVGVNFGANTNFPAYATDELTVSYDYYLTGNVTTVQVSSTAADTAVGNAVGMYDKTNGAVIGAGHMTGTENRTSNSQWGDSVRNVASIAIRKGSEVYPDYFYVWNMKIGSPNHGTVTYLESTKLDALVYNDYSAAYPNRNVVTFEGVNPTISIEGVETGKELEYVAGDVTGLKDGAVNDIDEVVDICDLVYLNNADSTFKDVRSFDKDLTDEFKSIADYKYVVSKIWEALGF